MPTGHDSPDPPDPGTAGASAQREHDRRAAAREERVKGRLGNKLGGVVLALTDEPQSTRAWAQGAKGERKLAEALAKVPGVVVLHDRGVRGTRGNIDHIVIAPAGVFVVDTKRYEGEVRLRDVGGLFRTDMRLYAGRRDCSRLADNMAWQVAAVEKVVIAAGCPIPVVPVLCFIDAEWPLFRPPDEFRGVRLEGPRSLSKLIVRTSVLDQPVIDRLARVLAEAFPPK
jgi:hypothetical protein